MQSPQTPGCQNVLSVIYLVPLVHLLVLSRSWFMLNFSVFWDLCVWVLFLVFSLSSALCSSVSSCSAHSHLILVVRPQVFVISPSVVFLYILCCCLFLFHAVIMLIPLCFQSFCRVSSFAATSAFCLHQLVRFYIFTIEFFQFGLHIVFINLTNMILARKPAFTLLLVVLLTFSINLANCNCYLLFN